ncbi:MAG: type I-U CRISPR-associated protein Cas7 [Phycisphaerales bacterium]|nr:type I-U CRISPR-associated protein Cas7 [Phycisphaerales bacterium]
MSEEPKPLTLEDLQVAVKTAAAFRCVTEYQPAGGAGDKIFPPTYEGGKYATEKRRMPGEETPVDCVLLDSVQSQANRMEAALLDAWERKQIRLPVVTVDFAGNEMPKVLRITSLEAPHRIADALLRDSLLDGRPFRKSDLGKRLDDVDNRNATALFELCPTSLIFGLWDSTGPKGGLGAKFQRAMVSEIVGIGVTTGVKTSSRIDPAQIMLKAGPLFQLKGGGWTLNESLAAKDKKGSIKLGKDGKPSEANHGNVTPSIVDGGVTIDKALQTTVISFPALRRLRFPLNGKYAPAADDAAQTALAALALCAATLTREQGCDLRSRCQLVAISRYEWELLGRPGEEPKRVILNGEDSTKLLAAAVEEAKKAKLPWMAEELVLKPSPELVALVKKSQELSAANSGAEEGGE